METSLLEVLEIMACFKPIAIKPRKGIPFGVFRDGRGDSGHIVPCGRCTGCRLERSRQWAVRGYCELQMHERSSFLTLTYRDSDLVPGNKSATLVKEHFQLFMKRIRKKYGEGIRFFGCGEYGTLTRRPHYHICLFGHEFDDKKVYSGRGADTLYTSEQLNTLWGYGDCKIGAVSFKSIAYVARYICEKKLGKESAFYQEEGILPEFVRMSLKPGLGARWFERYGSDVFPHDYMVVNGHKCVPPRYFSLLLERTQPALFAEIKARRLKDAESKTEEYFLFRRLRAKHAVKRAQLTFSKRKI